jgi:hypothetical protein
MFYFYNYDFQHSLTLYSVCVGSAELLSVPFRLHKNTVHFSGSELIPISAKFVLYFAKKTLFSFEKKNVFKADCPMIELNLKNVNYCWNIKTPFA